MWPITLSGRLLIVDLVGRYLTNYLIRRELTLYRIAPLTPKPCDSVVLCGISSCFQLVSPCRGQIAHALLTRPPLKHWPKPMSPLDLHVLGTPPAFVLSQDQTLLFNPYITRGANPLPCVYSLRNLTVLFLLSFTQELFYPLRSSRRSGLNVLKRSSLYRFQGSCQLSTGRGRLCHSLTA